MDAQKNLLYLIAATTCVLVLLRAGPILIELAGALANALAPLVLVAGVVIAGLRLLWHYTNRDS